MAIKTKAYSVKQINNYIKNMFDQDYMLTNVPVRGEISNLTYHSSGHIYFSIKDSSGTLSCIMFAGSRKNLTFTMEEGQDVIVTGKISIYEKAGRYQMYANSVVLAGLGELYEKYLQIKAELMEMGMFDSMYKKPIPKYVETVGIVTSIEAAALQDIIRVCKNRNPYVKLILSPCAVQGDTAALSIAAAIKKLDKLKPDIIIVGRGGGSIEDLWAFNERAVADAIFECQTPIISAVGHEVDYTIADYVADLRAATPSNAAEIAVFSYQTFLNDVKAYEDSLKLNLNKTITNSNKLISNYELRASNLIKYKVSNIKAYCYNKSRTLEKYAPGSIILNKKHEIIDYEDKIRFVLDKQISQNKDSINSYKNDLNNYINDKVDIDALKMNNYLKELNYKINLKLSDTKSKWALYANSVDNLSPTKKMMAGYMFVSDSNDRAVKSVKDVNIGDNLNVNAADGLLLTKVLDIK